MPNVPSQQSLSWQNVPSLKNPLPFQNPIPFQTSPTLNQFRRLNLALTFRTKSTSKTNTERAAQANLCFPDDASNSGIMASDLSGVQIALGDAASMMPSPLDIERGLDSMETLQPTGMFLAEVMMVQNAAVLVGLARESLYNPIQIMSAAQIPTPSGSEILSLTTTFTTPISTITIFAPATSEDLLRTLSGMEQRNGQLAQTLSKVFCKVVRMLLQVQRHAAQQGLSPCFELHKCLTPAARDSPASNRGNTSGSSFATAKTSVAVGTEPIGR